MVKDKIKILIVFGTRPEAIKLAPLIKKLVKEKEKFEVKICVTGQHREMLDQVLRFFDIVPDYDFNLMVKKQALNNLSASILKNITPLLEKFSPNYVMVQGDTTTSLIASLAAFNMGVKVAHVEAGLRTYNKNAPFPEEINRQLISKIADLHFAPTKKSKDNLLKEGVDEGTVFVTGNTVIDALIMGLKIIRGKEPDGIKKLKALIDADKKLILVTGHRRENFGSGFNSICTALLEIAKRKDVQIIYPVHLNPNVKEPVMDRLGGVNGILLIDPLPYPEFIWLMNQAYLILSDSGGIQEEAPSLGKPVLVLRDVTERQEAVEMGTIILVGTDKEKIILETNRLLDDDLHYQEMKAKVNPFGEGDASDRIVEIMSV